MARVGMEGLGGEVLLSKALKAEELNRRALEGHEAQLGNDHEDTKTCAKNLAVCLATMREKETKSGPRQISFPLD